MSHAVQESMGDVTEIAEEVLEGYRVVRIFGGQHYEKNKFNRAIEWNRTRDMKVALTKALNVLAVQSVIAIGIALIVLATIKLYSVIAITAGGFLSIIAAMLQLIKPMKDLTTVNTTIQRGLAGAESIFELLDEPLERDRGHQQLHHVKGIITYQSINFSYASSKELVLRDINVTIEAGQTVALVGRSGSGKSTFVGLLPRFYDPQSGYISLDGVPIDKLSLKNLREHIALVSQDVTLFNDTIANNIAYGSSREVSLAEIERAAVASHAMEFITSLPQGLHTQIGENGLLLSGGQRQRLAIARAILKDAPILILDEATSALDTESERYIQAALERLMRGRTTLVIAHRLSTIKKADNIIVLAHGQIIEAGTHDDLLKRDQQYARLYRLQFSNDTQDNVATLA